MSDASPPADTIVVGEAAEQYEQERAELAERMREADSDDELAAIAREGNAVEAKAKGAASAAEAWGDDAEVVIRGLDAQEYAELEDYLDEHYGDNCDGAARNATVAAGVREAPFLAEEDRHFTEAMDDLGIKVDIVKWLEAEVNERTSPDPFGWTSFDELLAETT
jgi:hypothetical protein